MNRNKRIQSAESVVNRVNKRFGLDVAEKSRKEEVVAIRSALGAALSNKMGFGPVAVGLALKRSHCTVCHYVKNHEYRYEKPGIFNKIYTHWYDQLCEFIPKTEVTKEERMACNALLGYMK